MKKVLLSLVAIFAFGFSAQAQEGFSIGAHLGLPMGDWSDFYSVGLGTDLNYMSEVSPELFLGGKVGYTNFFGKDYKQETVLGTVEIEGESVGLIPVAATGYYMLSPEFSIGTDLGAAFSTEKDSETAFYYQPKLGYQFGNTRALLGYEGYSQDGMSNGALNLGVQFGF